MSLSHISNGKSSAGAAGNICRFVQQSSRKAIFIALLIACVVGSSFIYFSDIKALSSSFVDIKFSQLTHENIFVQMQLLWTSSKSNTTTEEKTVDQNVETAKFLNTTAKEYLEDQQHGATSVRRHSIGNVSENTTTFTTTTPNQRSTALPPVVFPNTTTMTFNNTLVVHCKESVYIDCFPPDLKPVTENIFKIVYLRAPNWFGKSEFNVTGCKINQCMVQSGKVDNDADIVVVYGVRLSDKFRVPQMRPDALLAFHAMESPVHTHADFVRDGNSFWNNQINIIISYRADSEVFFPYGRLKFNPKPVEHRPNYYEIAKNKTRTVAWFVSNCKTPSRRDEYVTAMQKYIDVDIFGSCGTPCSKNSQQCENWHKEYKFYLSFENSLCTDYITEKFFKIFNKDIFVIPVVRGGADYDKYFANFTYINAAHFKTPADLAFHLKDLASNLEMYSKYLEYKDMYTLIADNKIACRMCEYVHTHKLPEKSRTHNLKEQLVDNQCHSATDL